MKARSCPSQSPRRPRDDALRSELFEQRSPSCRSSALASLTARSEERAAHKNCPFRPGEKERGCLGSRASGDNRDGWHFCLRNLGENVKGGIQRAGVYLFLTRAGKRPLPKAS